jgi:hypothetical protein
MKSAIFTFLVVFATTTFAQEKKQTIEQYCQLKMLGQYLELQNTVEVDYGEKKRSYKLKDENDKVVKFNSGVDALNYMGKQGWKLVTVTTVPDKSWPKTYYLFKKEIEILD